MDVNFLKSDSSYARIVQVVVCVVVVVLPLFYLPWTSSVVELNKHLLLTIAAAVGLVVWLFGVVVTGKIMVRSTPVDKGVVAVLAAAALATAFSMTPAKSIFGLAGSLSSALVPVAALTVFYFLAVNAFDDRGRALRSALSFSLLLALLAGIAQLFDWHVLPGAFTQARGFMTVGGVTALGVLAAVALPLFATSAMHGRWSRVPALAGTAASVLLLTVMNGWVLWAVALAGMLALVAFDSLNAAQLAEAAGRRHWLSLSRFLVPVVVVVLGASVLLVDFAPLKARVPAEITPPYGLSWHVVRGVVGEDLLFGWGPENFSLAFDRFGAGRLAETRLSSARFFDAASEALTLVVHGGLVALLAFALLGWCLVQVVARFVVTVSRSASRGHSAAWAGESSGTMAALGAIIVAWFLVPFNLTLSFAWYVLLALAALNVAGDRRRPLDIESRPAWSLTASLGFIVGLIAVLVGLSLTSTRYLADARYAAALAAPTAERMLTGFARVVELDDRDDRTYRDASQAALAMLREEANARTTGDPDRARRIQDLVASSVQLAQRAVQVAPHESLNWNNLGLVYQALVGIVNDVESLAEGAFRRASELRPGDPNFENRIGILWLTRADAIRQTLGTRAPAYADALARAEEAFKQAIERSPSFGLAIYHLGAVYERQGRADDAIAQLEKLAPYNADEPTLMFELGLLYIRVGRRGDAQAAMERAVFLASNYVNARWYLALLLEERGDPDGALAQLAEIRKSNPDSQTLLAKIAQLEGGRRALPPGEVIDTKPLE